MLGQSILSGAPVAAIVRPLFVPGRIGGPLAGIVAAPGALVGVVSALPAIVGVVQAPGAIVGVA
jgi:hypothetical protein